MSDWYNIHATAIVAGTTGLIFIGPSGSGKSRLAFDCMAAARTDGAFSALVADDRVLVRKKNGRVVADCPASICGLIEVRGTGIVSMSVITPALLHLAICPVDPATADRLPEEDEVLEIAPGITLPLVRICANAYNPLAIVKAKISSGNASLHPYFYQ